MADDEDGVACVPGDFCGDRPRVRGRVVGALYHDRLYMTRRRKRSGGLTRPAEFCRDDDVHTR